MKQGQATTSSSGSTKTEPKSQAINPGAVSRIGIEPGPLTTPKPLYEGRGLEAPMVKETIYHTGSQGKHK